MNGSDALSPYLLEHGSYLLPCCIRKKIETYQRETDYKYSITSIQRLPKGSNRSGLLQQVVFKCRWYYVDLRREAVLEQWSLKEGDCLIQVVFNAGLTVYHIKYRNTVKNIETKMTNVSSLFSNDGYVGKQPVIWEQYCANHWLKELQESMGKCTGRHEYC